MQRDDTTSLAGGDGLNRSFAGLVFDWDGIAMADRDADASDVRDRIEALCRQGVVVAVVSSTDLTNIDGHLAARPAGPGLLYLCLNRGSEVFRVDATGPELVWRRTARSEESAALAQAAQYVVSRLQQRGVATRIIDDRLNRRKIDLMPIAEWDDPPESQFPGLLDAVTKRIQDAGVAGLDEVMTWARAAALDAGLSDPRVTSDAKHIEIGLTDKADSVRWAMDSLWKQGIGPGLVLVVGDEFGDVGGTIGSDALMLVPEADRASFISVGAGGPDRFLAILDDQLARRASRRVPSIDEHPGWTVVVNGTTNSAEQASLLAVGNGLLGTRGGLATTHVDSVPHVVAAGIYDTDADGQVRLLAGPDWSTLRLKPPVDGERTVLDLHTGTVHQTANDGSVQCVRFVSLDRPEVAALRAEAPVGCIEQGPPLQPSDPQAINRTGNKGPAHWVTTSSRLTGGVAAAATEQHRSNDERETIERVAFYQTDPHGPPQVQPALDGLKVAEAKGFEQLLANHRAAWGTRWHDSGVAIRGDPEMELAARFALFHLHGSARDQGEAAVGARGLTGPAYAGHVFWDTDVFVLPVLAATHPASARAMLEYRIQRLPAARHAAQEEQRRGARFPWESAHDGTDVTPRWAHDAKGTVIPIVTGQQEIHIVADVAWAAHWYADWTGDRTFIDGPGRGLITETARYWASRIRIDDAGLAHIDGVTGPDEYHEHVNDNAFTNVIARWNLRTAANMVLGDGRGGSAEEATSWLTLADALVDGYDPTTGLYEQFAGFNRLEPLIIGEIADPPIAADLLLGRDRVAGAQIVKQADVLMLHHMTPDETAAGSLATNLDFYGPRTSHGSSLSPAIHASLLARAGRTDQALDMLRIAARIDLDDLTGTTAGGLHLASMGGVWQALAFGFAGLRSHNGMLDIDPRLPTTWEELELRLRFRGIWLRLRIAHDEVEIEADGSVSVSFADGERTAVGPSGAHFAKSGNTWKEMTP